MKNQPVTRETHPARKLTAGQLAELRTILDQRYAAGASIRALVKEFGYSYGSIHAWLTGSGVMLRPRGGSNRPRPVAAARRSDSR